MCRLNIAGGDNCDSPEVLGGIGRDEGLGEVLDLEGVGLSNDKHPNRQTQTDH